jgi:cytochrome c
LFSSLILKTELTMIKKIVTLSFIVAACYACGSNNNPSTGGTENAAPKETPAAADISKNPDYQKGLEIIAKNDCLTCHKVDETSTGPAYRDVANKYPDNEETIKTLAQKVIKGGSGNWGQVPMAGHPNLSEADAEQVVKYVLLLKTK